MFCLATPRVDHPCSCGCGVVIKAGTETPCVIGGWGWVDYYYIRPECLRRMANKVDPLRTPIYQITLEDVKEITKIELEIDTDFSPRELQSIEKCIRSGYSDWSNVVRDAVETTLEERDANVSSDS